LKQVGVKSITSGRKWEIKIKHTMNQLKTFGRFPREMRGKKRLRAGVCALTISWKGRKAPRWLAKNSGSGNVVRGSIVLKQSQEEKKREKGPEN